MLAALDFASQKSINTLIVAEEGSDPKNELQFEENIADTVIKLSVETRNEYSFRHFAIIKSRYQREQTGQHAFEIDPIHGLAIRPAPFTYDTLVRARTFGSNDPIKFGLKQFDKLLGKDAIQRGDVLVFRGKKGLYKCQLGYHFVRRTDPGWREAKALVVTSTDDTHQNQFGECGIHAGSSKARAYCKADEDILRCFLPIGYTQPGYVLHWLAEKLEEARRQGYAIDRIVFEDVYHWDTACPFIHEDETFADSLIGFLRSRRISSLFVCDDLPPHVSPSVQNTILNHANCIVEFRGFDFRANQRTMLQIAQTRNMRHRRDWFELSANGREIELSTVPSLLRPDQNGNIRSAKVGFFLSNETDLQKSYHEMHVSQIRTFVSPSAYISANLYAPNKVKGITPDGELQKP